MDVTRDEAVTMKLYGPNCGKPIESQKNHHVTVKHDQSQCVLDEAESLLNCHVNFSQNVNCLDNLTRRDANKVMW